MSLDKEHCSKSSNNVGEFPSRPENVHVILCDTKV